MIAFADFFHEPHFETALDQYSRITEQRNWPISDKLELYNWAKAAFDSDLPLTSKREQFSNIYDQLKNYWQVFRNPQGRYWSSEQTFDMLTFQCKSGARQGSLSLLNIRPNSQGSDQVLNCLTQLQDLKPQKYYPWMAVSKFTHFFNPRLFPIYDNEVIWKRVLNGVFRKDYKSWCNRYDLIANEYTVRLNLNYTCFAAEMIHQADDSFMPFFGDWFRRQVEGHGDDYGVLQEVDTYYATAFEFTAIGASSIGSG